MLKTFSVSPTVWSCVIRSQRRNMATAFFAVCGAGHLYQFFFNLHPLISIKQLSPTTAERIGVVYWIGVVLQFSGSITPICAIGATAPHLLVLFNCKINFNFETSNTTNRWGATTTIAPLQLVLLYLYHQWVWCYVANSTNCSGATDLQQQ